MQPGGRGRQLTPNTAVEVHGLPQQFARFNGRQGRVVGEAECRAGGVSVPAGCALVDFGQHRGGHAIVPRANLRRPAAPPPRPRCRPDGAGAASATGAALGGRAGDDLSKEPLQWAPGELSRMRRWHPDCGPDCKGKAVADAPPAPAVQWPPDWSPPVLWGASCPHDASGSAEQRLAVAFTEVHDGLDALCRCPSVAASCAAARGCAAAAGPSGQRAAPQPMLEWLLQLPAQWEAAAFPDDFGHFRVWKLSAEEFIAQGGSRFYAGDMVCEDGRHANRAEEGRPRSCCAVADAQQISRRILARLDPDSKAAQDAEYWDFWQMGVLPLPEVPAEELTRMPMHDVIEGFLGTFLYTYNLRAPPPGGERPLQIYGAANWAMRECADAGGLQAERLEQALSIFKPLIWRLDRFISAMQSEGGMLFRGLSGVRMARHYSVGKCALLPSITSLSRSGTVAWEFAGSEGGTWISVQAVSALNARWASFAEDEEELIFGSNTVLVVTDKPTDDERQVLSTTHDAVGLAQVGDAAGGSLRPLDSEATVRLRLQGMAGKRVIFRDFVQQYVEPSVVLEDAGGAAPLGGGDPPDGGGGADQVQRADEAGGRGVVGAAQPGGQTMTLSAAFESFLKSEQQWLLLVAPQGTGKSSALLWLYHEQLCAMAGSESLQGAAPVFVSLPLVSAATFAGSEPWLPAQLRRQLHIDEAGWRLLAAQGLLVFADSADGALLQTDRLRERCLADRAELPQGSKAVISVREEDLYRLSLTHRDIAGAGCCVLRLLPFADRERKCYVEKLIERQVKGLYDRLQKVPLVDGEQGKQLLRQALRDLPGCVPQYPAEDLHRAMRQRSGTEELKKRYKEEAAAFTRMRLQGIRDAAGSGATVLIFTMAAEVADELSDTRKWNSDAVIEAVLLRRMRRGAARVDPAAWAAVRAHSSAERVEVLTRVAEALAAALTLCNQWSSQIGPAAEAAAPLCEVHGGTAVLLPLCPGLPLRTASAEDAASVFALPHRAVQEWLAARWAVRAAERGRGEEALKVIDALKHWAGAWGVAAEAAHQVGAAQQKALERALAAGVERGRALRPVLQAHLAYLAQMPFKDMAAAELQWAAPECERLYGRDPLTAAANYCWGECMVALGKYDEAVPPLRRALQLRRGLLGAEHADTLLAQTELAGALLRSGELGEAEDLIVAAQAVQEPGGRGYLNGLRRYAELLDARGQTEQAQPLHREVIEGLERILGREHPEVLAVVDNAGRGLEALSRWAEALPLRRRSYFGHRRTMPLGHAQITSAARDYALALYRTGRQAERDEAGAVLHAEQLSIKRDEDVAHNRKEQLRRYRTMGAEGYAALLRGGQDAAGSRAWYERYWPEQLPELDQQLRRVADGLEPFEDPEGNANALYRTGQPADREAAEALLRAAGLWEQRQEKVASEREGLLRHYRRAGTESYVGRLQKGKEESGSRAWYAAHLPELLQELSAQLRRVAEGLEPFEDTEGKAQVLYRTGQPADREAAEALLRAAGLWEQRQEKVDEQRAEQLGRYRRMGAAGYAAHLRKGEDTAGSRKWCARHWPELLAEVDEQLRRVAEGLQPVEDLEGEANALFRAGLPADRELAEALLLSAGLWEQRQERLAECREKQLQLYRSVGADYAALLRKGEGTTGSRAWHAAHWPELLPELDEQLRRLAEGLEPFEDLEGKVLSLYRTGGPENHEEAEALLRSAGLWEQRQEKLAQRRAHLLRLYRTKGAAGYAALLRGEVKGESSEREVCVRHFPELVKEVDYQLGRMEYCVEPVEDPEGMANDHYRAGQPDDLEYAGAILQRAGLWEQRQAELARCREKQLECYRRMGAEGYAAHLRLGEDTVGSREWCAANCPELLAEVDEQLQCMAEGLPPLFEDPLCIPPAELGE